MSVCIFFLIPHKLHICVEYYDYYLVLLDVSMDAFFYVQILFVAIFIIIYNNEMHYTDSVSFFSHTVQQREKNERDSTLVSSHNRVQI